MAPQGARNRSRLAGRTLPPGHIPVSALTLYGEQGKPAFAKDHRLWFNLVSQRGRHCLAASDEGEVGCDIEVIRPRENWQALANAVSAWRNMQSWNGEAQEAKPRGSGTRKEATGSNEAAAPRQIVSIDSTSEAHSVSQLQFAC